MINLLMDDCRKRPGGLYMGPFHEGVSVPARECKVQLLPLDLSGFLEVAPVVGRR
ncbi:hypothetical protein D3C76_144880 [compost metagenome]